MNNNNVIQIDGFYRLRLLTVGEVAQILNISTNLVYRLVRGGELPAVHLGRALRVKPADLEHYMVSKTSRGANTE